MEMTISEKLRYYPEEGDIILHLDGESWEVVKLRQGSVRCYSAKEDAAKVIPVAHIRSQLIKNECFLCRKAKTGQKMSSTKS